MALILDLGMQETTGTTVGDASPSNNDGTIVNGSYEGMIIAGPMDGVGAFPTALEFNGSSNYITLTNPILLEPDEPYFIELFAKRAVINTPHCIIGSSVPSPGLEAELYFGSSTTVILLRDDDGTDPNIDTGGVGRDTNWHYWGFALRADGTVGVYIDAVFAGDLDAPRQATMTLDQIANNSAFDDFFYGRMCGFRIHDELRTQEQIEDRAAEGGLGSIPPTITSQDEYSQVENTPAGTIVGTITANGPGPITYSLADDPDSRLFEIDSGSGTFWFREAPDFENPTNVGRDNVYHPTVIATNEFGSDMMELSITITNIAATVLENSGVGQNVGFSSVQDTNLIAMNRYREYLLYGFL